MNNKGQATMFLLVGLLIVFIGVLVLIVIGFFSVNLNNALDQNVSVGQVNLKTVNSQTIGKFNEMVINNADWWGLGLIFGMILGLWAGAYFTRNTFPLLGIFIDIGIIFISFLVSLYLRAIYSDVVISLNGAGQTFAIDYLQKTNFFVLNLPIFIAIIGIVTMVIFHMKIPQKSEELNITAPVVTG